MKFLPMTAAAALAFLSGIAMAETNASGQSGDNPPHFGEKWTGMVGSQFFTDTTITTLRADADILTAWQSMTEEQRAMVKADCDMANTSGAATTSTENTSTGTDSQSADAGGQAAGAGGASGSGNSDNGGTDASTAMAPVFVSQDNMMKLCKVIAP